MIFYRFGVIDGLVEQKSDSIYKRSIKSVLQNENNNIYVEDTEFIDPYRFRSEKTKTFLSRANYNHKTVPAKFTSGFDSK